VETPYFLDLEQVVRLHRSLIERYGGAEGIRDVGLLHSALAMPQAAYGGEYLHRDIFEMAAAYLYHNVLNHPFLDGNKRAGAAAAIVFLAMNDIQIDNDEDGLVALTLAVAMGQSGKAEVAEFFRSRVMPAG
jgi:death on curing protein